MHNKVLQIGADNFGKGGRSIIAFNLVKNMSDQIQVDFLATTDYEESPVTARIRKHGTIYKIANNLFINLVSLVRKEKYSVVHIHVDQSFEAMKLVIAAKLGGCKHVIIHAHSSGTGIKYNFFQKTGIKVSRLLIRFINVTKIAVSKKAAQYMFGEKIDDVILLKDGIDLSNYLFNSITRTRLRKSFEIGNELCIGNVGRLSYEKKQSFLIKVFNNYLRLNSNAKLIIVGEGQELKKLKQIIKELHLDNKIKLLGYRSDIPEILQMLDVFVFPSEQEGFGLAALEAQAAGLPTLISRGVPDEVMVTNLCFKNTSWKAKNWALDIRKIEKLSISRLDNSRKSNKKIGAAGYDIEDSSKKLEKIYMNFFENNLSHRPVS